MVNCPRNRRVGPFFFENCLQEPRAYSRSQLSGNKGGRRSDSGTLFATHTPGRIYHVEQKETSVFDIHLQYKSHVACRGVACLILVFHYVVVLSVSVSDRVCVYLTVSVVRGVCSG